MSLASVHIHIPFAGWSICYLHAAYSPHADDRVLRCVYRPSCPPSPSLALSGVPVDAGFSRCSRCCTSHKTFVDWHRGAFHHSFLGTFEVLLSPLLLKFLLLREFLLLFHFHTILSLSRLPTAVAVVCSYHFVSVLLSHGCLCAIFLLLHLYYFPTAPSLCYFPTAVSVLFSYSVSVLLSYCTVSVLFSYHSVSVLISCHSVSVLFLYLSVCITFLLLLCAIFLLFRLCATFPFPTALSLCYFPTALC